MIQRLSELMTALLKLPERPHPPAGSDDSVQIFRASPGYFSYRLLQWGWKQAVAFIGIVVGLVFMRLDFLEELAALPFVPFSFHTLELAALGFLLVQLPFTLLLVRLDYEFRWYFVTDRSLRVREGLFFVREQTMTFANIQNLSINQGPLQRLLGIQDLEVKTAGGGSGSSKESEQGHDLHKAHFRGVDNAEEIRNQIRLHLRQLKDTGLGDPDERPAAEAEPVQGEITDVARDLLTEVRRLKRLIVS